MIPVCHYCPGIRNGIQNVEPLLFIVSLFIVHCSLYEMDGTEKHRHLRATEIRRALALLQEHVPDPEQRWSWGVRLIEDHLNTTLGVRLIIT